jgi:hypothetical protein
MGSRSGGLPKQISRLALTTVHSRTTLAGSDSAASCGKAHRKGQQVAEGEEAQQGEEGEEEQEQAQEAQGEGRVRI